MKHTATKLMAALGKPWLVCGFILLGCTSALQAEIHIWTSSENVARALDTLTPNFERDFGVKVITSVLNKDLTTQFKTAVIAGKGPDIFCWANDVVGELASSGLIEPIIMPPAMREQFLESALDSFTFDGKLYGYPYDIEAVALIRNTALLPQAPETFENISMINT